MKNALAKLLKIQQELKAPKGQYNSFGKYKYRSCEDILESVKPILSQHNCSIVLADELVNIGDRYYIKATATLYDCESGEHIENTAYAREEAEKKGMDGSQITGAASSYARKYSLNGLLCIDDTKDADTDAYTAKTKGKEMPETEEIEQIKAKKISKVQKASIEAELSRTGISEFIICEQYEVDKLDDLNFEQWKKIMSRFEKTPDKKKTNLNL